MKTKEDIRLILGQLIIDKNSSEIVERAHKMVKTYDENYQRLLKENNRLKQYVKELEINLNYLKLLNSKGKARQGT